MAYMHAHAYYRCMTPEEYKKEYEESITNPDEFWRRVALQTLTWIKPFTKVYEPGLENPFDGFKWFSDGTLNACYNAVDRHAKSTPNKVALIWEPIDPNSATIYLTYSQLLEAIQKVSSYLVNKCKLKKGDRVSLLMPTCPEAMMIMLGCARAGLVHNVVFAGMGREAVRARITDSGSRVVFVANACRKEGNRVLECKLVLDEAIASCECVERVIVIDHLQGHNTMMNPHRDVRYEDSVAKEQCDFECVEMQAEDPLFFLYTSGSTGNPKAMVHTTAGYLVYAAYSFKTLFSTDSEIVFYNTSDIGWVSCHSYGLYGVLCNGETVIWMEAVCHYPYPERPWDIIIEHQATHWYTSPTIIKTLMKAGRERVKRCESLRLLGIAGEEPTDSVTWNWYSEVVGGGNIAVVDTYWQTETGAILIGTIPGTAPIVPGHAGLPFMGIQPGIIPFGTHDEHVGALVIKRPWPGLARTIFNDHERYKQVYLMPHPGSYYTGDGASRDENGNFRIHGRIDDVINVGPIRITTAEIEGTLVKHAACSEAAVLGMPDDITGECVVAICVLHSHNTDTYNMVLEELSELVSNALCPMVRPKKIYTVSELPRTRSGKVMRRVMRKVLLHDDDLGDLSTLVNAHAVDELRMAIRDLQKDE